jgi:hypothetical protein
VSIRPTGLQGITAHEMESEKFEAFVRVAHMRTHNLTEHIRLAAARRARARAAQQFKFQKRFGAVIPGNGQFVSDLLDVPRIKSHWVYLSHQLTPMKHGQYGAPFQLCKNRENPC